jgi:hypothetical protein
MKSSGSANLFGTIKTYQMLAVSTLKDIFMKTTPLKSQENAFCQIFIRHRFLIFFLSDSYEHSRDM